MFGLTKRIPVFIQISKNKIAVKRLDSMAQLKRSATRPFTDNRLLLANYDNLIELTSSILDELTGHGDRGKYKFIFQLIDSDLKEVAQTEKMCLNDLGLRCGADWVQIVDHTNELSELDLIKLLEK